MPDILDSGKSLKEIVDQAALYLSEHKRVQNKNILYKVSEERPDKFFMKALKKADPHSLYTERNELHRIKRNREKIKKIDKIKRIIIASLAGVCVLGSIYLFKNRYNIGDYLTAYYTSKEVKKIR